MPSARSSGPEGSSAMLLYLPSAKSQILENFVEDLGQEIGIRTNREGSLLSENANLFSVLGYIFQLHNARLTSFRTVQ